MSDWLHDYGWCRVKHPVETENGVVEKYCPNRAPRETGICGRCEDKGLQIASDDATDK